MIIALFWIWLVLLAVFVLAWVSALRDLERDAQDKPSYRWLAACRLRDSFRQGRRL